MLRLKRFVFLLVAGLAMAFEGCAGFSPGSLETHVTGSSRVLLAPVQSRSILLEPRHTLGTSAARNEATRPALTVAPSSMAFLSQPGTMLTQNSDGTIGIRNLGVMAARPGRSEQALQANLWGDRSNLLNPALVQILYPSCPLPD